MGRMKEQLEDVIRWTLEEVMGCPVDDVMVADYMARWMNVGWMKTVMNELKKEGLVRKEYMAD